MAAADLYEFGVSVQETVTAPHPTTNTFRSNKARIVILGQCRQLSDDIQFGQSRGHRLHEWLFQAPFPFLVVQFVVAVKDEETGELWGCDASPRREQIYITTDGMFKMVPKVDPYAWILPRNVDFKNRQLPHYAGNLAFLLPVEHESPVNYTVTIKLCQGIAETRVLDMVQFFITSHKRGTNLFDNQSGRTITEVEKPVPKIRMQGALAIERGRTIIMHFQNLGDNGQYNQFVNDRVKLTERVDGIVKYQDLLLAVLLEEAIIQFGQNKMEDCLATCRNVCARATHHNSSNWPFLQAKANYIISAVYRQAKEFDMADEYMEISTQCLEAASLSEETAVNRYNKAALLTEKAAAVGITTEEAQAAEEYFKDAVWFWKQQQENVSMRCPIRTYNREITYHLKTSRQSFPDLRRNISGEDIAKASKAIEDVERNLLHGCPKRLLATFLIGKADLFIRKATMQGFSITERDRARDFERALSVLEEAMVISQDLKLQKEIEGIKDRRQNIRQLFLRGLDCLNERPPQIRALSNQPCERNTDDIEEMLENLILGENEQNRRREDQCSD